MQSFNVLIIHPVQWKADGRLTVILDCFEEMSKKIANTCKQTKSSYGLLLVCFVQSCDSCLCNSAGGTV